MSLLFSIIPDNQWAPRPVDRTHNTSPARGKLPSHSSCKQC